MDCAPHTTFLSLPGELRNGIYSLYIADISLETVRLDLNGVHIPPPLARVCQQVREEVQSLWQLTRFNDANTKRIHAHVLDLGFQPLQTFFQCTGCLAGHFPTLRVVLVCTDAAAARGNVKSILDWIEFVRKRQHYADRMKYAAKVERGNLREWNACLPCALDWSLRAMWVAIHDDLRKRHGEASGSRGFKVRTVNAGL